MASAGEHDVGEVVFLSLEGLEHRHALRYRDRSIGRTEQPQPRHVLLRQGRNNVPAISVPRLTNRRASSRWSPATRGATDVEATATGDELLGPAVVDAAPDLTSDLPPLSPQAPASSMTAAATAPLCTRPDGTAARR
jgi:hypothetical protein